MKTKDVLELFQRADVVTVDDSPMISSFDFNEDGGELSWTDDEGQIFSVQFNSNSLETSRQEGLNLVMQDAENNECEIHLFKLENLLK